jgi:hypothetical protein
MHKHLRIAVSVFGFLALIGIATMAQAQDFGIAAGDGTGTSAGTIVSPSGDGWEIGGKIYYDPNAGPWNKNLLTAGLNNPPPGPYLLLENLVVGAGPNGLAPSWTDYHETIVAGGLGGFIWRPSDIAFPWSCNIAGTTWTLTPGANATNADWIFPAPQAPGTNVILTKWMTYTGALPLPNQVTVAEYPTVPEPGTFVLLAAGLLTLVLGYCWRRR